MKLTPEEATLVAVALRQKAGRLAELATRPYGKKVYRQGLAQLARQYERLAAAFATHTEITLTKKD